MFVDRVPHVHSELKWPSLFVLKMSWFPCVMLVVQLHSACMAQQRYYISIVLFLGRYKQKTLNQISQEMRTDLIEFCNEV